MERSIASATARLPMAPANYWLLKSEPSDYSIAMMQKEQRTVWDGVRNAVAQKNMRSMAVGDRCLFYHSSCKLIGIVGLVSVCRAAYDDPTDGKYSVVDVQHEETWPQLLSLDTLKMHKETALNGLDRIFAGPFWYTIFGATGALLLEHWQSTRAPLAPASTAPLARASTAQHQGNWARRPSHAQARRAATQDPHRHRFSSSRGC